MNTQWVEFVGGPEDGEMDELYTDDDGQMFPIYQIDSDGREGIYRPSGRAVSGLPIIRMVWTHRLPQETRRRRGPP